MLASFLSGEFLLHILCWLQVVCFFKSGEFLLHIQCWIYFFVGSFSYTSRAGFVFFFFFWGVSLAHPMLDLPFCGEFLFHIPCWLFSFSFCFSYTSRAGFFNYFYWGSFSYTSCGGFIFIVGVSLTHPVLDSFLSEEFLLHIPCWIYFS